MEIPASPVIELVSSRAFNMIELLTGTVKYRLQQVLL
jgi:hypothetical protein